MKWTSESCNSQQLFETCEFPSPVFKNRRKNKRNSCSRCIFNDHPIPSHRSYCLTCIYIFPPINGDIWVQSGRAVSRLDAVFLFSTHTSMIRGSCSRRINCCVPSMTVITPCSTVTLCRPLLRHRFQKDGGFLLIAVPLRPLPSFHRQRVLHFCSRFIPRNDLGERERRDS